MKKRKFSIGMRNLKTAFAVFLCMLVFLILSEFAAFVPQGASPFLDALHLLLVNRSNPIFACVASVIVMQSTVESSLKLGRSRILGTIVGGSFGLLFLWLDTQMMNRSFNMLLVCVGIIMLIALLNFFDKRLSVPISLVTFLIIMITIDEKQPYAYAVNRIIDTAIGVMISLAVNRLVKNPRANKKAKDVSNGENGEEKN